MFTIRRFLGLKKDIFFIGHKPATPKEVLELLSSAGVLTSNPYHFVRQGEINSLAEASPAQRLKLLEDFAGTTIHKVKAYSHDVCLQLRRVADGCVAKIETFQSVRQHTGLLQQAHFV